MLYLAIVWMLIAAGIPAQESTPICDLPPVDIGATTYTFTYDELERSYMVYVPESYDPTQPTPMVISFHGASSFSSQQATFSAWNPVADEHGFIVVYPNGTGLPRTWNSGLRIGGFERPDDVAFVDELLDRLKESHCVDPARVYANGFSNGGGMTHRLACERSDSFAAYGTVGSANTPLPEGCEPTRPIPMIGFHGTEDPIVPYEGSAFRNTELFGFLEWGEDWAERNGCNLEAETLDATSDVSGIRYSDCDADADVVLYTIEGGGHTWPGGAGFITLVTGPVNDDISASAMMWDFYENYTLETD